MSTIVLGESIEEMFRRGVATVLEARGTPCADWPLAHLQRLLKDRPRLWTVRIQRPRAGMVAKVDFKKRSSPRVYDSLVRGVDKTVRGEHLVRVRGTFGVSALCELVEDGVFNQDSFETACLLAISSRDLTVLLDIVPDKDYWIAVAVWANETLPMDLLLQRPEKPWTPAQSEFETVVLSRSETTFATTCALCEGSGKLDCGKCHTSGYLPCARCDSRGKNGCPKCQGSGVYKPRKTCPTCNGSGNFIGKYGDVMGSCRSCSGKGCFDQLDCGPCSGTGSLECRGCNGQGRVSCRPCNGTGSLDCYRCKSSGFLHIHFSTLDGRFTGSERDNAGGRTYPVIAPRDVCVFNWVTNAQIRVTNGAARLLSHVTQETQGRRSCEPVVAAQIEEHCRQFQAIEGCLTRSLETTNILEVFPIHIGRPEGSITRSRDGVVYEFPVTRTKHKAWVRDGQSPFPPGSPVQLCMEDAERKLTPIDLPLQDIPTIGLQRVATFAGSRGRDISYRLAIRFPTLIDISKLPSDLILRLDSPPPPEKTQLKHLRRWCSPENRDHPVLRSIVLQEAHGPVTTPLRLGDPGIATFPRQMDAVRLAVSGTPLGLIKGPPGTGKTTIITEIVRQLAMRSLKVLICSQTHQAVRNVLERLHREGGFRMIRHARPDDPKLSDIEKSYLGGGADDAYFSNVLSRSKHTLDAFRQKLDSLGEALRALPGARDAAQRLADVRNDSARQIIDFAQQAEAQQRIAQELLARHLEESKIVENTLLGDAKMRHHAISHELAPIKASISKAERERVATAEKFRKRTGQQPEVIHFEVSLRRWIRDTCIPHWLAGTTALQERYSAAVRRLGELSVQEQVRITELESISNEESAARKRRIDNDVCHRNAYAETVDAATRFRDEQCGSVRDAAKIKEEMLRSIQANAAIIAREFVIGLSDDATSNVWQMALTNIASIQQTTAARCKFMAEWIKDIESEPRDVLACYWDHLQVFFSTCVGVGSWRRLIERGRDAVDLVIIDEAAHATATETLIPLLYSKRALLIGDEMQLPPIMPSNIRDCSEECSQLVRLAVPVADEPNRGIAGEVRMTPCWLGCSYFEWIWRARPGISRTMLDTQFRMHPSIADFVGSVFYPEGLSTGVSAKDRELAFGEFTRPVCLISTSAYADRHEEFLEPGYRNVLEAQAVRRVVQKAEAELRSSQEFGIITPYAEQKNAIVRELADLLPELTKVRLKPEDVASVDSFQGSERDVIIVSFARSPKPCSRCDGKGSRKQRRCDSCQGKGWRGTGLTFARDLRRLNVAFSRARKMLILIGDIKSLTDSRYRGGAPGGKVLDLFTKYVADRGKVLHLWERQHEQD